MFAAGEQTVDVKFLEDSLAVVCSIKGSHWACCDHLSETAWMLRRQRGRTCRNLKKKTRGWMTHLRRRCGSVFRKEQ